MFSTIKSPVAPRVNASLPSIYCRADDQTWEFPPGYPHCSYSIHMLYLAYINMILLARLKCGKIKIYEIKYGKITHA